MSKCYLLGIDPGFATMGLARVELAKGHERIDALGVVRTVKSVKKRAVRASDDNLRRIVEIAAELEEWIVPGTIALCCESQSWPRSASVSAKVGMCWGVIGALAARHGLAVLQSSPKEIKVAVAGKGTASKLEVQAALERRYGALDLPKQKTLREHPADALGAVVAVLDSPTVLMARSMMK